MNCRRTSPDRHVVVFALAVFVAAQMYTVPIATIGPSWAVWPTLPDIAFVLLLAAGLLCAGNRSSGPHVVVFERVLFLCVAGCAISYLILVVFGVNGLAGTIGIYLGGYQLARLAQVA